MKKLVLLFAVAFSVSMFSCGGAATTETTEEVTTTEEVAAPVEDAAAPADTVAAPADSATVAE